MVDAFLEMSMNTGVEWIAGLETLADRTRSRQAGLSYDNHHLRIKCAAATRARSRPVRLSAGGPFTAGQMGTAVFQDSSVRPGQVQFRIIHPHRCRLRPFRGSRAGYVFRPRIVDAPSAASLFSVIFSSPMCAFLGRLAIQFPRPSQRHSNCIKLSGVTSRFQLHFSQALALSWGVKWQDS